MDKKQRLYFAIAGALSALVFPLSMLLEMLIGSEDVFIFYLLYMAGVPYGIATGLYLKRTVNIRRSQLLGWIVGASLSYLCAAMYVFAYGNKAIVPLLPSALGGFIGAAILIIAFRLFIANIPRSTWVRVCMTSIVIVSVWGQLIGLFDIKLLTFLFLCWQFVISYILTQPPIVIHPASSEPSTPAQEPMGLE